MKLKLTRPIVFFDLETTGLNLNFDAIVELAAVKIWPDQRREQLCLRLNPERVIPPEVTAIHGITNEDVADAPVFREKMYEILQFFAGCDLGGFGIVRFDVPMLTAAFQRENLALPLDGVRMVDSQIIFHRCEPRDLGAALRFYCNETLNNAHSAQADTLASLQVLEGQLERYEAQFSGDLDELNRFCSTDNTDRADPEGKMRWRGDDIVICFGQKAGKTLRVLASEEPGYLQWILKKEFNDTVKGLAKAALEGKFPKRESRR